MKSTPRTFLNAIVDRLASTFAILGTVAIVAAIGTFLVLGTLDRVVIVLLAVGVGCWVYAALEQPERTVQILSSRNVRYGSNSLVMSAAFIGILGLVNVLANRYSQHLDLTQNQYYTLSPLSVQVVHELAAPVEIYAFYQAGQAGSSSLEDLLKEYVRQSNSKISYQFVDPQLKPGLARQYNVQSFGTTVLVSGDKQQSVTGSDESSITSALIKLERNKTEIVYYLTGHGELDFGSSAQDGAASAKAAIEAGNFSLKSLNLGASGKVPADAAALIVAGPTTALAPPEVAALEEYLDHGGKALFLVDRQQRANLEPIVERYGVQIGNGVIIDPQLSYMGDPLSPLVAQFEFSPITNGLPELLFQTATSVTAVKTPPAGLQVQTLAQTSPDAWLNTDLKTIHYQAGVDPKGPLPVAVSVTKTSPTSPAATPTATAGGAASGADTPSNLRIVFVGDVAFATNPALQVAGGNKALLTNAINWLTANEDLIQIPPKVPTDRMLILSSTQLNVLLYGSAAFIPFLVLVFGGVVWWNRR